MPAPHEDVEVDPTVTQSAEDASREETATKSLAGELPQAVLMPRFAPPATAGEIGRLGKYRIQKELGRGGMGAVYLAFDERLQRRVALKVMLPKAYANHTAAERFLREARAAAQISSDHVVNIYEADEVDGIPYIALQYLQGYPLDAYLKKKGNPTIAQTIRIGSETALGLAKAHKLGIVHRDIKPGNLWLEAPSGRVKILDFGLAKPLVGAEGAELTGSGAVLGTPAYMAPEQGMGKPIDGRADLFSLGCVLYRLCTGKLPFDHPTIMAILTAIATEEPTPVRELNPAVPEALADLIHRLMAKKADDRPASAQAVAKELDQIAESGKNDSKPEASTSQPQVIYVPIAVSIQESNPFADIDDPNVIVEPKSTSSDAPQKSPQKFPAILIGSLVLGLAVIVAVGAIAFKFANTGAPPQSTEVAEKPKPEVKAKPNLKKEKDSLLPASFERTAAEYIISIGGIVGVNGQNPTIRASAALPREAFVLTGINLESNQLVDDAGLGILKGCKDLTSLNLNHTRVGDVGLANFKDCKSLSQLSLGLHVGDAGLAHFQNCSKMQILSISSSQVTDTGLAYLKEFNELESLDLGYCQKVSDVGMMYLKGCRTLTSLTIVKTPLGDASLEHLKECKRMELLNLGGSKVTDAGLAHLKDFKNLIYLAISDTNIGDAGLAHLKGSKNLTALYLSNTKVSDAGLTNLKECIDLLVLDLSGTNVSNAGLEHFKDCKNLINLIIRNTKITAVKFEELKKLFPKCKIESDHGTYEPTK